MQRLNKIMVVGALALALPVASLAATTWTMASGYPEESFFTQNIRQFIAEIETESGGRLKIDLRPNGTLIKHDAIKRAVQAGQVQAGEIRLGVYGNENPVYNLDGLPNIASNYEQAMLLTEAQKPFFDELFGKNGMRVITYVPWPGQGFYTKTPVQGLDDFKGKKLRIYSQPTQKMGEMLGFDAIILPFAEVAQAFATGLIDAQFTSAQTGIDTQAWDNCKYYTYTGTQHTKNALIVNERALRALEPDVREIVLKAGERATQRGLELSRKASDETMDELRKHGMEVKQAPQEIQDRLKVVGETMMDEWRKTASPDEQKVLDNYLALRDQADSGKTK